MNKFIPLSFTALLVFGCGGDSSSSDVNNNKEKLKDTGNTTEHNRTVKVKTFPIHIQKTGQTHSVKDFDDGYYKKGVDRNYTRDDNRSIVTDYAMGLEWQDDQQSQACQNLDLNGTGWRLPTIIELANLINYENGEFREKAFKNFSISGGGYISSTGETNATWSMWIDHNVFLFGKSGYDVICVRDIAKQTKKDNIKERYTKHTDTVSDNKTGLIWQKGSDINQEKKTWGKSVEYCHSLSLSGFDDWRLPNINELVTLINDESNKTARNSIFKPQGYHAYWSSTDQGMMIDIYDEGYRIFQKDSTSLLDVRCVRDDVPMKFISCTNPRPEVCTADYTPVCTKVVNGSTISYDTKSNSCSACLDHKVLGYSKGECQ